MSNFTGYFKDKNGNKLFVNSNYAGVVWQNPNENTKFAAQTISVDLSGYDYIIIEFKHHYSTASYLYQRCAIPCTDVYLIETRCTPDYLENESREVTVNRNSVVFGSGYRSTGSNAGAVDDSRIIPVKIRAYYEK